MNGTIYLKKVSNAGELKQLVEVLWNYVSELDPNVAEQGMAGFCMTLFPETALPGEVIREIAQVADEADETGNWQNTDAVLKILDKANKFPLYVALPGREAKSSQDYSDWWQWGINVYTENEVGLGHDPSWDLNDFIEEQVM